jgi:ribosomal protein S27AE
VEPSKDLGFKYFSSSSDISFRNDQKNNPQDYKYIIVSIFNSREDAITFEVTLHKKFNVGINPSFYNKSKQTSDKFDFDSTGNHHTEETRRKISESAKLRKGRPVSKETKTKLAEVQRGRIKSQDEKDKLSKSLSTLLKGKPLPMSDKPCPHCKKIMAKSHMTRWHGDKCKFLLKLF